MADLTNATIYGDATLSAAFGANKKVDDGQGLGGKTYVVQVGVGGGAISQAAMDGIVAGIQQGASLQTGDTSPDAFTVVAVAGTSAGAAFNPGTSTSAILALQGTGTVSAVTGDYYASATLSVLATFPGISG